LGLFCRDEQKLGDDAQDMANRAKYTYHYRPAYGSANLLIEFVNGVEDEAFAADFLEAIKKINPQIVGHQDLWMNDEIEIAIRTDFGRFMLSKDVWGFAFIMSDENQSCLAKINNLLVKDDRFEKIEVDFDKYKLAEKVSD
jgi:hypothetical protein